MTKPIPCHDFGGNDNGRLIHFAHSNGFPPACFQQMINPLLPQYRVIGMHHRPLWPNSQPEELTDWNVVADDMIRFFDQEKLRGVVGVGHSLGAVATMFTALKRPDLFRALVLIEPVFLPPHLLEMVAAHPDAANHIPLVDTARRRRNNWPNRQAAFDHFRAKDAFTRWSDAALWDYVNGALVERNGAVHLAYRREWEARFYSRPPTTVWDDIPRLTHPTLAIHGADSNAIVTPSWQRWQQLQPDATFVELADSGHMVTMERPDAVAGAIINFLEMLYEDVGDRPLLT